MLPHEFAILGAAGGGAAALTPPEFIAASTTLDMTLLTETSTNFPAGGQANDLILLQIHAIDPTYLPASVSGYSLLADNTSGGPDHGSAWWYRIHDGTEAAPSITSTNRIIVCWSFWRGVDTSDPFDGVTPTRTTTASVSSPFLYSCPAITPNTAGTTILGVFGCESNGVTTTVPGSQTEAYEEALNDTHDAIMHCVYEESTSTATRATFDFDGGSSAPSTRWSIVLKGL
jgi:hypothetical protein